VKAGDVYQWIDNLGEVPAGLWVVVETGSCKEPAPYAIRGVSAFFALPQRTILL